MKALEEKRIKIHKKNYNKFLDGLNSNINKLENKIDAQNLNKANLTYQRINNLVEEYEPQIENSNDSKQILNLVKYYNKKVSSISSDFYEKDKNSVMSRNELYKKYLEKPSNEIDNRIRKFKKEFGKNDEIKEKRDLTSASHLRTKNTDSKEKQESIKGKTMVSPVFGSPNTIVVPVQKTNEQLIEENKEKLLSGEISIEDIKKKKEIQQLKTETARLHHYLGKAKLDYYSSVLEAEDDNIISIDERAEIEMKNMEVNKLETELEKKKMRVEILEERYSEKNEPVNEIAPTEEKPKRNSGLSRIAKLFNRRD